MWWLIYIAVSLVIGVIVEMCGPRMPWVGWPERILFALLVALLWPVLVLALAVMLFG